MSIRARQYVIVDVLWGNLPSIKSHSGNVFKTAADRIRIVVEKFENSPELAQDALE